MRREYWQALVVLGVGGVYGGGRVLAQYWDFPAASDELPQAIRDYRAAGLPWTAADIARNVPPGDNAAPVIRQAIAALPDKKIVESFRESRISGKAAGPLIAFAPSLRLAHLATKKKDLDFGWDWDEGPNLLMPESASFKLFCGLLAARAEYHAARGEDDAALADLEDARRLAFLIGQEPTISPALVGTTCDRIAADAAQRCLSQASGAPERLARYRRWLLAPAPLPDLHRAYRGQIYAVLVTARNLDRLGIGRGFWPGSDVIPLNCGPEDTAPEPTMRREGTPKNVRTRAYMARCLQMWTEVARTTDGLSVPIEVIGQRSSRVAERYFHSKGLSHQFDAILFPEFGQACRMNRVAGASRAVALAFADALILYARTGRWPTASMGKDPLGDGPLKTRFDGKRFRVWSVGRDGKDDGGLTGREANAAGGHSDDFVAAYPPIPAKIARTAPSPYPSD